MIDRLDILVEQVDAIHDLICVLTENPLIFDTLAPACTCAEAETIGRFLQAFGFEEAAAAFVHGHASSDDSEDDAHHEEYNEIRGATIVADGVVIAEQRHVDASD